MKGCLASLGNDGILELFALMLHLDGGVEKWEDGKLWEDGNVGRWKIFSFPSCVFGWRGGKVGG